MIRWLIAALLSSSLAAQAQIEPAVAITVQIDGGQILVDARVPLPVSRQMAWDVMTDFNHMAQFLSSLKECRVVSSAGNRLTLYQRGAARFGLFSYSFEMTRSVELTPLEEVRTHLLEGTVRKLETQTTLKEENGQLWLIYHSDSIQSVWMPALIARAFVEHETREQFWAMRAEMIRRQNSPRSN